MSDTTPRCDLVRPAVQAAMKAAKKYLHLHKLEADGDVLSEALAKHVKVRITEALDDAREAIECGMTDVAEQTFVVSMVLAGIDAAKEVGRKPTPVGMN